MTDPWKIHTVVFDLDDTLYPEVDFVLSGFSAVNTWLLREHGVEGFFVRAQRLFASGQRGNIFDQVLRELGIVSSVITVNQLVKVYREHDPMLTLGFEVEEVLAWSVDHFHLALITDGFAAVQARKIRALGLERYISCRIITDEMGRAFWKPHPSAFLRVMEAFPGTAEGYVYVADNPKKDFIAPRQLGWRTLRIKLLKGEHAGRVAATSEAADREVSSLLDLASCVQPASGSR